MADDLYYGDAALGKRIYTARAITTAMVIYSTAAGTGGPLLWNNAQGFIARILKVGYCITTASGVIGGLGFTGAAGQTAAPGTATAIDAQASTYIGGPALSQCTAYRIGTPTNAGTFFCPFAQITTAALTTAPGNMNWIDVNRLFVVPYQSWIAVSASATLTSAVIQTAIVWEEVPLPL